MPLCKSICFSLIVKLVIKVQFNEDTLCCYQQQTLDEYIHKLSDYQLFWVYLSQLFSLVLMNSWSVLIAVSKIIQSIIRSFSLDNFSNRKGIKSVINTKLLPVF